MRHPKTSYMHHNLSSERERKKKLDEIARMESAAAVDGLPWNNNSIIYFICLLCARAVMHELLECTTARI